MNDTQNSRSVTIPLQKLFPSMVTIFALCLSITGVRYALVGKFNISAALIVIAAFMDGVDGRLARLLNSTSEFGAQLDSLADLVSFGVSPAITMYLWSLINIPYKGVGWTIVLFYITCSALRLARFNVQLDDGDNEEEAKKARTFFTGVPMPSAAGLTILPMIMTFEILPEDIFSEWFIAVYMVFIGFFMVSRIPTFSSKRITIKKKNASILLLLMGMLTAGMVLEPWIVLPLFGIAYFCSIPISIFYYYKLYRKD